MQKDAFKPVGREISVVGMNGPMGPSPTRMMAVGPAAPTMARQPQPQPQGQAPIMVAPAGRGAQISGAKEVPRGAQQVRLATAPPPPLDGGPIDRGASFQPAGPGAAPAPGPEMAGPGPAPRPYLQRANGSMIVRVVLRGVGPDGAPYEAPYDAEFAPGTHSFSVNFAPLST